MNMKHILAVTSAALLISVALPAQAIDLGVGGTSIGGGSGTGGGTTASASSGATTGSATVGGGTNVASATVGSGDSAVNVGIGNTSGSLLATSSDGDTTSAIVNLGGTGLGNTLSDPLNDVTGTLGDLLDNAGLPGGGDGGGTDNGGDFPGVIPPTELAGAFGGLSAGEQLALRNRCRAVILQPQMYERDLVELCRILVRLQMPGG